MNMQQRGLLAARAESQDSGPQSTSPKGNTVQLPLAGAQNRIVVSRPAHDIERILFPSQTYSRIGNMHLQREVS